MRSNRLSRIATVAVLALAGGALGMSTASATVDPAPIGPHQYFVGQVNGASTGAVIRVACPGPVVSGQTGHPLSGQTVDALPTTSPASSDAGYTGEAATSLRVSYGNTSVVNTTELTRWAVTAPIPTTLNLPCSGSGTVVFAPSPTSTTARSAVVAVSYENVAV